MPADMLVEVKRLGHPDVRLVPTFRRGALRLFPKLIPEEGQNGHAPSTLMPPTRATDLIGLHPDMTDNEALGAITHRHLRFRSTSLMPLIDFSSPRNLFEDYRATDEFESAYAELVHPQQHFTEGWSEQRRVFSTRVLRDLVEAYLPHRLIHPGIHIPLPDYDTMDFWHWLYPRQNRLAHGFGTESLADLVTFDGIIADISEKPTVAAVVKSTYRVDVDQKYVYAHQAFLNSRKTERPQVLTGASLIIAVPKGSPIKPDPHQGIEVLFLPFTRNEFISETSSLMKT